MLATDSFRQGSECLQLTEAKPSDRFARIPLSFQRAYPAIWSQTHVKAGGDVGRKSRCDGLKLQNAEIPTIGGSFSFRIEGQSGNTPGTWKGSFVGLFHPIALREQREVVALRVDIHQPYLSGICRQSRADLLKDCM